MAQILHVDDDPGIRKMFADVAEMLGHEVVSVSTANAAADVVRNGLNQEPPVLPALIVSDRHTGVDDDAVTTLTEELHDMNVKIPVVAFSSRTDTLPEGVISLRKPADFDQIEIAINHALEQ